MTTRRVYYRRRFLNRPRHHLGAHVIAEVEVERPTRGRQASREPRPYVEASLHLADCSRCIVLDLTAENRAEAANALRKLGILRETLDELETSLREAFAGLGLLR